MSRPIQEILRTAVEHGVYSRLFFGSLLVGGLFPNVIFSSSCLAQEQAPSAAPGFFDNGTASEGLANSMDVGVPKRRTSYPQHGSVFGMGTGQQILKKPPPPALVPEIERENGYSVPVNTPHPPPTPEPTPAETPPPNPALDDEGDSGRPPQPEYYRQLFGQARNQNAATPTPEDPHPTKPKMKSQSYTF